MTTSLNHGQQRIAQRRAGEPGRAVSAAQTLAANDGTQDRPHRLRAGFIDYSYTPNYRPAGIAFLAGHQFLIARHSLDGLSDRRVDCVSRQGRSAFKFSRRCICGSRTHSLNLAHQPRRQAIADVSSFSHLELHSSAVGFDKDQHSDGAITREQVPFVSGARSV